MREPDLLHRPDAVAVMRPAYLAADPGSPKAWARQFCMRRRRCWRAIEERREGAARHTETIGGRGHRQFQRIEAELLDHLPGVWRVAHTGHCCSPFHSARLQW
jgi:hypothetical protein